MKHEYSKNHKMLPFGCRVITLDIGASATGMVELRDARKIPSVILLEDSIEAAHDCAVSTIERALEGYEKRPFKAFALPLQEQPPRRTHYFVTPWFRSHLDPDELTAA